MSDEQPESGASAGPRTTRAPRWVAGVRTRLTRPAPAPDQDAANGKLAGRLAKGAAVVTALLATYGVTGGQLDRLLRNEALPALVASALLGVSIGLGILLTDDTRDYSRREASLAIGLLALAVGAFYLADRYDGDLPAALHVVLVVAAFLAGVGVVVVLLKNLSGRSFILVLAVVLFFVGCGLLSWLSVTTKSTKERPRIQGQLVAVDDHYRLHGHVHAQGLTNREVVVVSVEGLNKVVPLAYGRVGRSYGQPLQGIPSNRLPNLDYYQTLWLTRSGPDADGAVDIRVQTEVDVGLYERVRISARIATESGLAAMQTNARLQLAMRRAGKASGCTDAVAPAPCRKTGRDRSPEVRAYDVAAAAYDRFHSAHKEAVDFSRPCDETARERACLVFTMPGTPRRPVLTLSATPQGTVSMTVQAWSMNPDDLVGVTLTAGGRTTWRGLLAPDVHGHVKLVERLKPGAHTRVCAQAVAVPAPFPTAGPLAPAPDVVCQRPADPATGSSAMLVTD